MCNLYSVTKGHAVIIALRDGAESSCGRGHTFESCRMRQDWCAEGVPVAIWLAL
jgi:hypothetical protein